MKFYSIAKGLESLFDLFSKPWFYCSKYDKWFILRLFGVYLWIYPKEWFKRHTTQDARHK